jgi:AraC-like DNA-binding protein
MDTLAPIFSQFSLSAKVFYSGNLCTTVNFDEKPSLGYLHVLREGKVQVSWPNAKPIEVSEPTVLFFPKPTQHQFRVDNPDGANLVCATIGFDAGIGDPILQSLPEILIVPMVNITGIDATLTLLFNEAFAQYAARQPAIDRLSEYFLVLLLRHAIEAKLVSGGILAGLADARLALAMNAINARPEHPWTLDMLAHVAGMSRARFAAHFKATTNITPAEFLIDWRVSVAQKLLRRGKPLKMVAPMVGYSSAVALTRAFSRRVGATPGDWLHASALNTP